MKKRPLNSQVKRYICKVKKLLNCSAKSKSSFTAHLKSSIHEYISESPGCTMEDITAFFGRPDKLARDFMETLSKSEIQHAKKNLLILRIVLSVLVVCIIVFLLDIIYHLYLLSSGTMIESIHFN